MFKRRALKAGVRAGAEGEKWNFLGERIVCRVRSEETFGRFTLLEETSPAAGGLPLHFHEQTDKLIYVVEGEYEFQMGRRVMVAGAGDTVLIPRGTPHGFRNRTLRPGRLLAVMTPSGAENFFAEASRLAPDQAKNWGRLAEIGRRSDFRFVR